MSGGIVYKAVSDIPDALAEKAIEFQKSQLGKNPGPYDIRTRSCLTHVMGVLAAGDVNVPDSVMRSMGLFKRNRVSVNVSKGGVDARIMPNTQ